MKSSIYIILITIIVIAVCIGIAFLNLGNKENSINENQNKKTNILDTNPKAEDHSNLNKNIENSNNIGGINMDKIIIKVNGRILNVKLEDNTSSRAFVEKLKAGDITISAKDYGNFEKVGNLGFNLPTNDENITTESGDLILYQGNQITLYYDTNSWNFTRLGKVQNVSQTELKEILGIGNVELTFSLNV